MKRIPQLDSLRGIAILMVLFAHVAKNAPNLFGRWTTYGFSGVDLFFVLSGFLITGILLKSKTEPNYFSRFYARRAVRIWPLYYAFITVTVLVLPHLHATFGSPVWTYAIYVQNLLPSFTSASGPLYITWSLAVEEQFYVLWPLLVFTLSRRALGWLALAAMAACPMLRFALHDSVHVYSFTLTHIDGICWGSAIACWNPRIRKVFLYPVAILGFAAYTVFRHIQWDSLPHMFVSLAFSAALLLALQSDVRSPLLEYTGKISYCLYLIHVLVFDSLRETIFKTHQSLLASVAFVGVSFALCYAVALLSWKFFEGPLLAWRGRPSAAKAAIAAHA